MFRPQGWIVVALLAAAGLLVGCGSDEPNGHESHDASSHSEADATQDQDGGEQSSDVADATLDADASEDETIEVEGDVENRPTCNDVCSHAGYVCDPEYEHYILGPGGGYAEWGEEQPTGGMVDCDERPEETNTDILTGEDEALSYYVCYCKASEQSDGDAG